MTVFDTNFKDIPIFRKGKVRDVYDCGDSLIIVATDRISAFDCIMNEPIPNKGKILSSISKFWFKSTNEVIPNHLISDNIADFPKEFLPYKDVLEGRSMLVKKSKPLPIEFVVRGYLAGSGWKEYQKSKTVCGIPLPDGLQESSKLPNIIFTPATKAEIGHDENIGLEEYYRIIGKEKGEFLIKKSIQLYEYAYNYLLSRGIILADTKFEFGEDENGKLILIDEALTPDSSRFWLQSDYAVGKSQTNFDKQILRDWLETLDWDKNPPAPVLPQEIISNTFNKYDLAHELILGKKFNG